MTNQGRKVVAGFYRLSISDREEVLTAIHRYWRANIDEKRQLRHRMEEVLAIDLGPLDSDRCPCCGK